MCNDGKLKLSLSILLHSFTLLLLRIFQIKNQM